MPIISLYTDNSVSSKLALKIAQQMRKDYLNAAFQHDVEVRRFVTDILVNANAIHADVRFRKDSFWTDENIDQAQKMFMMSIETALKNEVYRGKFSCLVVAEPVGSAWSQIEIDSLGSQS